MDYPLENLGPERFQEFCQALLAQAYPNLQCFPVGQADGLRDAWLHRRARGSARPALFQVKFVRRSDLTREAHRQLVYTMKSEIDKLDGAMLKGIDKYILLTNVPGTAALRTGSIDRLQEVLDSGLPTSVSGEVWWRDDIARRLDTAWSLKWVYPELMSGPDLLRVLIEAGMKEDRSRRANTIDAFMVAQYRADQEVKFKQVELQNRLVDLFVDVPASPPPSPSGRRRPSDAVIAHSRVSRALAERGEGPDGRQVVGFQSRQDEAPIFFREDRPVGAASLLLHPIFQASVPKIVLEGAPGQGKSTIGQYICQVHRARLLAKDDTLLKIPPEHKSGPVRLPFRIDLRDLASWLSGRDPFNVDHNGLPQLWQKTLDAFLCAQIRHASGGAEFSVVDLHAVLRASSILLVFDGLDEVADVERRREVVDEIARATARLEHQTLSLQAIVTSRPAAFANSPGPSEEDFPYFHLDSLPHAFVVDYSERWLKAKKMSDREAADLRKLLREKLEQPHMRDLARNPMQLAILLSLMHTRGASLPDKRTALYDSYVDLFFNREAEKSHTVREHRDLLIGIHQHLAWLLHGEAQEQGKDGSITDLRLREVVRNYLVAEGHDTSSVEELFTGMVERVVVLVSRVQGTYEFEVQPLREYFAARYLYETAPYSPPGREQRGTVPDRFDALARDFYWLNVTRFYAGCFSKGELPGLVDRIQALITEEPFRHTAHPRVLAAMLLSDWVFAQSPRSVTALATMILDGVGLRAIAAALSHNARATAVLVLPKSSGRDDLVNRAFTVLEQLPPRDYGMELVEVLRANGTVETLEAGWRSRFQSLPPHRIRSWIEYGQYLGLLRRLTNEEMLSLCSPLSARERMEIFFTMRRPALCAASGGAEAEDSLISAILDLDIWGRRARTPDNGFEALAASVESSRYTIGIRRDEPYPLRALWGEFGDDGRWPDDKRMRASRFGGVLDAVSETTLRRCSEWATSLEPWSLVVDAIVALRPRAWSAVVLASAAAGIVTATPPERGFDDLLDPARPLCQRVRTARLKAGQPGWWSRTLNAADDPNDAMLALLAAGVWASGRTLVAIREALVRAMFRLSEEKLGKVIGATARIRKQWEHAGNHVPESYLLKDIPPDIPDVALPLFVARGNAKTRQSIYVNRLYKYNGISKAILGCAQAIALELMGSDCGNWERELNVVSRAYQHGVLDEGWYTRKRYSQLRTGWIPSDVARNVTANAEKFPSNLVLEAQMVCTDVAAKELVPVGMVARRDRWFEHG